MTYEQIFDECQIIFDLNEQDKAKELFKLLDKIGQNKQLYPPFLNHLIREVGIYPYINTNTSIFSDKLVCECFKVNVGELEPKVLHREQSRILKILLSGENLILSAPTSFGKSFIIDAIIAIKKPTNTLIIVPTISLMDETRRRLTKKFVDKYHIITTSKSQVKEKNIIIFPQERALEYFENLPKEFKFDFFIVDEFYKVSSRYDKDRASVLQHTILKYSKISKQRYYLCPNIDKLNKDDSLCKNMKFIPITNNTVFIDIHKSYEEKNFNKNTKLIEILNQNNKTLIYTKSQNEIKNTCDTIIRSSFKTVFPKSLKHFSQWILKHYGEFYLINSLRKAVGIHYGKLHRCLSQIQVKLFEETNGLQTIISTSSLIEGINIPAKNLILWNNKKATSNLDSFTYKNILGRSGRMFQYFVGRVFLLEKPPKENEEVLDIEINIDSMVGDENIQQELPSDKQEEIQNFREQLIKIIGKKSYEKLRKFPKFNNNKNIIIEIAKLLVDSSLNPRAFSYLLDNKPDEWFLLNTMAKISQFHIQGNSTHLNMVDLIKQISFNWQRDIPTLLQEMNVSLETFFEVENHISFKISSLFADMNILAQVLCLSSVDISPFVTRLSNAFLPSVVFTLEEFGLPRMLSKKLHKYKFINFEDNNLYIDDALMRFKNQGIKSVEQILTKNNDFDEFDKYILNYFYDGLN